MEVLDVGGKARVHLKELRLLDDVGLIQDIGYLVESGIGGDADSHLSGVVLSGYREKIVDADCV